MVKKRELVIFVFVIIWAISFSSAAYSCENNDDIILKLSANTNAHGEVYNGRGNYDEHICFSDLFGQTAPNPRLNCDSYGSNAVVYLSDTTNAHARTSYNHDYEEKVCFSGLSCTARSICAIGEVEVLKLSATTNAHLAISGVPDSDYATIICCEYNEGGSDPCNNNGICDSPGEDHINCPLECDPPPTFCGDGNTQGPNGEGTGGPEDNGVEECDDGNSDETDECDTEGQTPNTHGTCTYTFCGDGEVQDNPHNGDEQIEEECDLGERNGASDSVCDINCRNVTGGGEGAYWADLNGFLIAQANIGNPVKLFLNAINSNLIFDVYERDPEGSDSITPITGVEINQDTVGDWILTAENMEQNNEPGDYEEFYFEIDSRTSNYLEVLLNSGGDDPPTGEITSPTCGTYYEGLTTPEIIKFHVSDSDDVLIVSLTVDGVSVPIEEDPIGSGDYKTVSEYLFNTAGTIKIRVYAIDDDGDEFSMISNVIVIDDTGSGGTGDDYVAACITSPENYEYISTNYVTFNATSSVGIHYDGGVGDIPSDQLIYDWTFSDGRNHLGQDGSETISNHFNKYFNQYGGNWADLKISAP